MAWDQYGRKGARGRLDLLTWKRGTLVENGSYHTWTLILSFIHKPEKSDGRGSRNRETSVGGVHHAPVPYLYYLLSIDAWFVQVDP